jgi:hypothetical protein
VPGAVIVPGAAVVPGAAIVPGRGRWSATRQVTARSLVAAPVRVTVG